MTMNQRVAYGQELVEQARHNKLVVAFEADVGNSTRSLLLQAEFPERHFDMGIAEQNMVATAAGMALCGQIPFVNSFAVFVTGRAFDQIRQSVCLPNLNVKICGVSAGLSSFGDGASHQSIEDVALMRALPNMTVLVASDSVEAQKMVRAMIKHKGPCYLRLTRNDGNVINDPEGEFEIGKLYELKKGKDAVIFAMGVMVEKALQAAKKLEAEGISAKVINVSTIKPLDAEAVIASVQGAKGVVTAEEHNIYGGLGSAIAQALAKTPVPVEIVGVQDCFGRSSHDYDILMESFGLTADAIVAAVKKLVK